MDGSILVVEGIGDISIKRKNDEHSLIKYVVYILGVKCNLLSIGQLLRSNLKIHLENKVEL